MRIKIHQLEVETIIGVYDWEKKSKQKLYIDIEMNFDARKAMISDDLNDTIDYDQICTKLREKSSKATNQLIEKLALDITTWVFKIEPRVIECSVEVFKPSAIKEANNISFKVNKKRS